MIDPYKIYRFLYNVFYEDVSMEKEFVPIPSSRVIEDNTLRITEDNIDRETE